jgi:hypothetical protein
MWSTEHRSGHTHTRTHAHTHTHARTHLQGGVVGPDAQVGLELAALAVDGRTRGDLRTQGATHT